MPAYTLSVSDLAELLKLPAFDSIDGLNFDYYVEQGAWAYRYAIDKGASEDAAEAARDEAESEAHEEVFDKWEDGVMNAAETLFDAHGLKLVQVKSTGKYRVLPVKSWREAADAIRETINGVGYFHFANVTEFARSIPTSVRGVAISHLHWIADYPEVYGTDSARRIFDRAWR